MSDDPKLKCTPGDWRFTQGALPRVVTQDGIKSICGVHHVGKTAGNSTEQQIANGHMLAASKKMYLQLLDAMRTMEAVAKAIAGDYPALANNHLNQCAIRCSDVLRTALPPEPPNENPPRDC